MTNMKSEILSRKIIKPSSPTPPDLKTFNLSLLDQLSTAIHGNMTFFYPSNPSYDFPKMSLLLQDSLSETLSLFYPLAGRLQDSATVDCSDEGTVFVEADINIPVSDFLSKPDFKDIDHFLPTCDPQTMELSNGSMFLVQLTSFTCGGVALSLSLTHKLADICALLTLLQSWTSACRQDAYPVVPHLNGAELLPPRHDLPAMSTSLSIAAEKFALTRFVISAEKIAELKSKVNEAVIPGTVKHPSRVEVVLALIWKCAIQANKAKTGKFKPTALFQAVNLRKRMNPPLPETTIGNFIWPFMVLVENESDVEIHELVIQMRKAFNDFCNEKADKFKGEEGVMTILGGLKERGEFFRNKRDINVYKCSSWCKFPLFGTDFGWGKPLWHTSVNRLVSNTIALADTSSGDGVEVLVTLDEEEMAFFEENEELMQYATLNPSIDF